jgi:PKD repeat protein
VPGDWLATGWHTAGLLLSDPGSGTSSLAEGDFEVIEIVPLSVELSWDPVEPDANELVQFEATVNPTTPEVDFVQVVWDFGDGTVEIYNSCPPPFFTTCLAYPYAYSSDGWYDVSVTVETATESAVASERIKVGDPISLPVASFTASPSSPNVLENTALVFDGSCVGTCSWSWDFGDGGSSVSQNPTHSWEAPNTYTVELTVTNDAGSDTNTGSITVTNCWEPTPPTQSGICYGQPIVLTAAAGGAWLWSTGSTNRSVTVSHPGAYWVNVEQGAGGCWGHSLASVVLTNCGDSGGDANLDGRVDAADPAALITELTDGDGDTVIGSGGGDLTAPGGDATGDGRLRVDDLLLVLDRIFD